ncbi:MAG: tRNA 2-thiocytidine(32) synthetase TtcA [Myxococcota bacterium]|nr:tRNA 2-thiocytidine(32) synthetase TtcA [Myxococcota bacterium]
MKKSAKHCYSGAMDGLEKKLARQISQANRRFGLIEHDDRVMVAVSGGKDSWSLLSLLRVYRNQVPFDFSIIAVTIDQGQPGFDGEHLEAYYKTHEYDYRVVYKDTYSVVVDKTPEGKAYCSLCSRMRRGILYRQAAELGATKIALGHHRDDLIETLLLNQFYSGRVRSMAPKLVEADGGAAIIRPLVFSAEKDLLKYSIEKNFPIIPCNLCGSQANLKRHEIKRLLTSLESTNPRIRGNLLASLGNIDTTHLLLGKPDAAADELYLIDGF